jgi:hypothetical protein
MPRPLRWLLRDTLTREAAIVRAAGAQVSEQLDAALREAINVASVGNAALIFTSSWSPESLAIRLSRAETATGDDDHSSAADQEQLAAAPRRIPIWIDEMPLTVVELGARVRRFAAEWQTFREDGEALRWLALVVLDGWPGTEATVSMRALRRAIAMHRVVAMRKLAIVTCGT